MFTFVYLRPLPACDPDRQIQHIRQSLAGDRDQPTHVIREVGAEVGHHPGDRAGWRSLIDQLRPGSRVVVWTGAVLYTTPGEFLGALDQLGERGAALVSVKEGLTLEPGTRERDLLRNAVSAFRSLGFSCRSRAIKAALDDRRARGVRYCHRAPVGKRWVGRRGNQRPEVDPEAVAVAAKVREWRQQGHTWAAISSHLRRHGVRRRAGVEWNADSLRRLLGVRR